MSEPDPTPPPNVTPDPPSPPETTTNIHRPLMFFAGMACLTVGLVLSGFGAVTLYRARRHVRPHDVLGLFALMVIGLNLVVIGLLLDRRSRRPPR